MKNKLATLRTEGGFALIAVLLGLMILATVGIGGLLVSGLELKSSGHYKTGNQAFYAAESGLVHALSTINARGVLNFGSDFADATEWTRLFGAAYKTMEDGTAYQVTVAADPVNAITTGRINGIGFADTEARRVLQIVVRAGRIADVGALYLAADTVASEFGARDQFLIDGNDHNLDLTSNPTGPIVPGVSTRNDTITEDVKASLSDPQKERVQGMDFSLDPLNPSVVTTEGPTVTDLERIIDHILNNNPVTTVGDSVLAAGEYGTIDAPQITHLTSDKVRINGNMTGAGILIADGEFTVNGDMSFIGWVIVRGDTILDSGPIDDDTNYAGNAIIAGSLWTGDLKVHVGGSAVLAYCRQCMELANTAGNGNNVPKVMDVVSWQEIL